MLFDQAVRSDLQGEGNAALAFSLFKRAAEAGLPEAEFNVAVMLDSGRGVEPDAVQAACWYAKAALHGDQRAAYDLGQLYDSGHGVPRNADLAKAWFAESDLPAGRNRRVTSDVHDATTVPSSPVLIAPFAGAAVTPGPNGIEFVWTEMPQQESVRFFVEILSVTKEGLKEYFSQQVSISGLLALSNHSQGDYVWRVSTIYQSTGHYLSSKWSEFSVQKKDK